MCDKVSVAIIDTGLRRSHKDFAELECESYYYDPVTKSVCQESEFDNDQYGHGTACAWIIHRMVPEAKIISLKALDSTGQGTADAVLACLEWAINRNVKVVNLSLGNENKAKVSRFNLLGEIAFNKGIFLIAAFGENSNTSIPAALEKYIGVYNGQYEKYDSFTFEKQKCVAWAYGSRQRVGWNNRDYVFIAGNSFSAAHMSAIIAGQIQTGCESSFVWEFLQSNSSGKSLPKSSILVSEIELQQYNSEKFEIGSAALCLYNKETESLLKFNDLLDFKITGMVDIPQHGLCGKDLADILRDTSFDNSIVVQNNLEKCIVSCDTIIISRTHILDRLFHRDMLKDFLETAIDHNKNIYSLEYVDYAMYPDIFKKAQDRGLKIRHPILWSEDLLNAKSNIENLGHLGTKTPVLGIFGTGSQQGKFTIQLLIRRALKKLGYKVCNLGTEIQSELLGFEEFYPMEIEKSVKFSQWEMITYIKGLMRTLEYRNPDLIVVGSQSGIIPYSYGYEDHNYTLPSISFLMATIPHAYILTVNPWDDIEFVQNSIHALQIIGKGKVILLAFSDNPRMPSKNKRISTKKRLTEEELEYYRTRLEQATGIPATEIMSDEGQKKIVNTILNYFS